MTLSGFDIEYAPVEFPLAVLTTADRMTEVRNVVLTRVPHPLGVRVALLPPFVGGPPPGEWTPMIGPTREFDAGRLLVAASFVTAATRWLELNWLRRLPAAAFVTLRLNHRRWPERVTEVAAILGTRFHDQWRATVVGAVRDDMNLFPGLAAIDKRGFFRAEHECQYRDPPRGGVPAKPVEPGVGGADVAPCFVVGGPPRVADG